MPKESNKKPPEIKTPYDKLKAAYTGAHSCNKKLETCYDEVNELWNEIKRSCKGKAEREKRVDDEVKDLIFQMPQINPVRLDSAIKRLKLK